MKLPIDSKSPLAATNGHHSKGEASLAKPPSRPPTKPPDRPKLARVEPSIAETVVRLLHGKRVSGQSRKALTREWESLAQFAEDTDGDAVARYKAVQEQYLPTLASRKKKLAETIRVDLKTAWEAFEPGDESDEEGRNGFSLETLSSSLFFATDYVLEWLVGRVLVAKQPAVIGGPKKALKTSILIDLAISLATGTAFLDQFVVGRACRVGFFSGESGPATIKDCALRVCDAKGLHTSDLEGIIWGFRLPQLSQAEHLAELARVIRDEGLEVVIIDPLYLCLLGGGSGRRLDAANLFDMGPLLMAVAETCLSAGATPLLTHHFKKNRESPHDTPELEDLAFAGIQEFARQWILIGRRERFETGSGLHKLWLTVGGSAGHSGDWALDIDEGTMDDNFAGRRWGVTVKMASDAKKEVKEKTQAAKVEVLNERGRIKAEAKDKEDAGAMVEMLDALKAEPDRKATKRRIRELTSHNNDKVGRLVARAEKGGYVRPAKIGVRSGKGQVTEIDGYEWVRSPSLGADQPPEGGVW